MPSFRQKLTRVVSQGLRSVETLGETTGEGLGEARGQRRKEPRRSRRKRRSSRCVGGWPGDPARQPRGWSGIRRGRRMAGQIPAQPLPKPATRGTLGATLARRPSGGPNLVAQPPSAVDHLQLPSHPPTRSHGGCHVDPPYLWRAQSCGTAALGCGSSPVDVASADAQSSGAPRSPAVLPARRRRQ
jgi:hypothetical protein